MSNHTDVSKFLQAVFPDYAASAIFAHSLTTGGMAHTRNPGSLFGSRDCYWSIAAFPDDGTAVRTLARALEVRCLVIDDVGTKVSDGAVLVALGAPTAIVETSSGNFQWVYRLATPVAVSDWAKFFRGVEALVGQRLEGRDAVHLFRLPFGVNTKPGRDGFAVRLVEITSTNVFYPIYVTPAAAPVSGPVVSGPVSGPGPSGGTADISELRALMALIPNTFDDRETWIEIGHGLKALCDEDTDGFTVFDEWSATHPSYDAAHTRSKWDSFGAGAGLLTKGGALRDRAEKSRAFAVQAFDDGVVPSGGGDSGGVDFFVDQEKSSLEVVRHFRGRIKQVGRGDWREFDEATGRWREWTGDHMLRRVLELVAERKRRPLDPEVSKKLGSVRFIEGIARAAALHRDVIGRVTDFDRGALLLGVPSGVIDLRAGASRGVRQGRASEMVSKAMWVDPAPAGTLHPEWSRFLAEFTQGDAGLEEWLQVRAGYCLTGLMDEYIMPFYHGSGGNGKSVYLNALRSVWGEYGAQIEHRLLFEKTGGYHLAPLAVLSGVRLAIVTDVPQGASWDVHIMKMLTGDDAITANRMHQNPITFKSTAKVDVSGNGEPVVKDMDEGVRRRLKLIPLTAVPKAIDKQLSRKLMAEWPAILSWALVGLDMYWALGGMPVSKTVDDATKSYHNMLDPFQRWVDECVVKDGSKGAKVSTTDLFRSWDTFRSAEGRHGMSPQNTNAVARKMGEKGFSFSGSGGYKYLWGYKTNSVSVF